jgi:hypothetical protein
MKLLPALLILAICASCATRYQSDGLTGGFTEVRLAADQWRISFRGNAYTRPERTHDFALLRGAELCLSNGYPHLVVLNAQERTRTFTTPSTSKTSGEIRTTGYGRAKFDATTRTTGGITHHFPTAGLHILGLSEPREGSLDASYLRDSLRATYKLKP